MDADGWIVNSDGSSGVDVLKFEDTELYQGYRYMISFKVNDIIDKVNVLIVPKQLPIADIYPITMGQDTYVDGMTNVIININIGEDKTGCRIWTRGGTGVKDIVVTAVTQSE